MRIEVVVRLLSIIVGLIVPMLGHAADWKPSNPVRLIVPVQGGTVDILARLVAPKLEKALGQPVIVEDKGGAGGNIGTDLVAKSAPNGETILVGYTAPITVNVTLFDKLPYNPQKDLIPITLAVTTPQFLTVNPTLPVHNVAEFNAAVKAGASRNSTLLLVKRGALTQFVMVPNK